MSIKVAYLKVFDCNHMYLHRISKGFGECKILGAFDFIFVAARNPITNDPLSETIIECTLKYSFNIYLVNIYCKIASMIIAKR